MSTATLESPAEQHQRELSQYKMPEVQLGQFVMHFADNGSNEDTGVVAQVIGVWRDLVTLNLFGAANQPQSFISQKSQVRHRSDPRLATGNKHILMPGCWDYTPWEKQLRGRLETLETTVNKLVNDLGGPSTKGKKSE